MSESPSDLLWTKKAPTEPSDTPVVLSVASRPSAETDNKHLLLIDSDDQIVYSGPSTGMSLFARLGILRTVEVTESEKGADPFASHSAQALGIAGAAASTDDYLEICMQACPQELMFRLLGFHLDAPIFFPLLHAPSFISEFIAVTQRRLPCTAQYGALLMSVLAVTIRLVEGVKVLFSPAERDQAGQVYFALAQDLIRRSSNKLDIRHILALYHLAVFSEGAFGTADTFSSLVGEAIGLAFATGLHRNTNDFNMDPVTQQIRTRLFWALYILDTALTYSQGRPALIRSSECSVDLPVTVDNDHIKKTAILPQPEDQPPLAMAATVKTIETCMVLEQVLSTINAPLRSYASKFTFDACQLDRGELLNRARDNLDLIEKSLPPYLLLLSTDASSAPNLLYACRVKTALQFVRILVARQSLIDQLEACAKPTQPLPTSAISEACAIAVDIVKIYARLRHMRLLRAYGFNAVSHLTAAAHTLVACMLRCSDLALEHRPNLLNAIDILLVLSSVFPNVHAVTQLLTQLSISLDNDDVSTSKAETVAIRVLASKMTPNSPPEVTQSSASCFLNRAMPFQYSQSQEFARNNTIADRPQTASYNTTFEHHGASSTDWNGSTLRSGAESSCWPSPTINNGLGNDWALPSPEQAIWGNGFSFLNDGLSEWL